MLARLLEEAARPPARSDRHIELAIPPDWWPTWREVLDPREGGNQSVLLSPHSNAELTRERYNKMRRRSRRSL